MFEKRVVVGKQYCVITPGPVVISASINNIDTKLVNATESGKYYFIAPTTKIHSSIDTKCIFEPDNTLNYNIGNSPCWFYSLKTALHILLDETKVKIDLSQNKLAIQVSHISGTQLQTVSKLLERVLPRNLVTEINSLPIGFTPLAYIENRSKAFIKTENKLYSDTELESEYFVGENSSYLYGALIGYSGAPYYLVFFTANKGSSVRFDYGNTQEGALFPNIANSRFLLNVSGRTAVFNNLTHNTKQTKVSTSAITEFETSDTVYVLSGERSGAWCGKIKLYSLKGSRGGVPQFNFLPALDPAGVPCLFDTVSRKAYGSVGSGHFVAGVETQKQLDAVLSGLPDRTGQDGGELHLCLSDTLYEAAVASGIIETSATAKNWQIAYDPTTEIAV